MSNKTSENKSRSMDVPINWRLDTILAEKAQKINISTQQAEKSQKFFI